jgi:hypothetical protein
MAKVKIQIVEIEADSPEGVKAAMQVVGDLITAVLLPPDQPKRPRKQRPKAITGEVVEIKQPARG